ncbi:hypothetical protein DUZ99_00335 [Xylanibacillus composti]|uniref:Uncharacterized protein n=1 Tax=Xylanibacillus composti TaxID=1572762 RepID=A0A8J4H2L9_9BACL|nr:hypothetical protein [Xylanibacillus composti]GIQ68500.1 hypothetical protein XYCOK13_13240 [Xylanibacillus composti]
MFFHPHNKISLHRKKKERLPIPYIVKQFTIKSQKLALSSVRDVRFITYKAGANPYDEGVRKAGASEVPSDGRISSILPMKRIKGGD